MIILAKYLTRGEMRSGAISHKLQLDESCFGLGTNEVGGSGNINLQRVK